MMETQHKQTLQAEKKRIEDTKKCLNCGDILEEQHKKYKFMNGTVCNRCFLSTDSSQIKKWNE